MKNIQSSPTTLRGGLLYTEASPNQAIFINQNMLPITRQIDSTALASGIELQKDLDKLYANHCDRVALSLEGKAHPFELSGNSEYPTQEMNVTLHFEKRPHMTYFSPPSIVTLAEAAHICTTYNGTLPEIRTEQQKEQLRILANREKISNIYSGIIYDQETRTFRYKSDMKSINDVPLGNKITYGGDYNTWDYQGDYCNDPTLHSMAGKFPIVYNDPKQTFRLKMATNDMLWSYSKIICQTITYPEPTKIEVPPKNGYLCTNGTS